MICLENISQVPHLNISYVTILMLVWNLFIIIYVIERRINMMMNLDNYQINFF